MLSKRSITRRRSLSDPLSKALQPPRDETPDARERRLKREAEAKNVSDAIDEQIKADKAAMRKQKQTKILLLGQSESGKSTTLKQFQLLHAPSAFRAERFAWRTVIYLNLIRSVRRILDALVPPPDAVAASPSFNSFDIPRSGYPFHYDESSAIDIDSFTYGGAPEASGSGSGTMTRPSAGASARTAARYEKYARRLAPLLELEQRLMRQLSFPEEDEPTHLSTIPTARSVSPPPGPPVQQTSATSPLVLVPPRQERTWSPSGSGTYTVPQTAPLSFGSTPRPPISYASPTSLTTSRSNSPSSSSSPLSPVTPTAKNGELALRPTSNWKKSLSIGLVGTRAPKSAHTGEVSGWWEDPDDPVHVLNRCANGDYGMVQLWRDPDVRAVLQRKRVRMEESSGFYLNEIERITAFRYIPTDDDVLKARLKTLGVVEHTFSINGSDKNAVWKIYDVGGARHQRPAWMPYFEDVNAIIFLAPISAFDQTLAEDPRVNRLEDSMLLWRSLVQNKLLANVNIILFLNKCDLLKAKLEAGVSLGYHMPSYKDRPNDYDSVSKYFRNKFGALHQTHTPNRERELYIHLTSVTDQLKTSIIINNVRDIILRDNLHSSRLI